MRILISFVAVSIILGCGGSDSNGSGGSAGSAGAAALAVRISRQILP